MLFALLSVTAHDCWSHIPVLVRGRWCGLSPLCKLASCSPKFRDTEILCAYDILTSKWENVIIAAEYTAHFVDLG